MAILLLFAASAIWINPWRETPLEDDWAYARTAETLRTTGDYVQHNWLAPNYPAHAAIGAAAQAAFGDTFGALRVSTLALAVLALASLYVLARAHRLPPNDAGMLALIVLACPLFLRYSFNYMTDVPFLAWFTAALAAYTIALRRRSTPWMIAGAFTAAAAILTRQFGLVLLIGLAACWWQSRPRRNRTAFFAAGAFAPAAAGAWQVYAALTAPSWSAQAVAGAQREFLFDLPRLIPVMINRAIVILHYGAFFTLPIVVLVALLGIRRWFHLQRRIRDWPIALRNALIITAGIAILALAMFALLQSPLLHNIRGRSFLMPYLPWNFGLLQQQSTVLRAALTALTLLGAVFYARLFILRARALSTRPVHERLIDYTTLAYLAVMFLFIQIGDEYLLPFLPWALIVAGRERHPYLCQYRVTLIVLATFLVLIGAAWIRQILAVNEARWALASTAVQMGADPADVYSTWTWTSYHRFDQYAAIAQPPAYDDIARMFNDWLPEQREHAAFRIVDVPPNVSWTIISTREYWRPFGTATLYLVRRGE